MADSSILDGNRWPHWGQFCGLTTPARVDLRGGPPERLEPACGCNSSARSINSYDTAGLILPWFILYRALGLSPGSVNHHVDYVGLPHDPVTRDSRLETPRWICQNLVTK